MADRSYYGLTGRRIPRWLAATTAAAIAVIGLPVVGAAAASAAIPTVTANPDLAAQCGLDIGLVLDASGSIKSAGAEQAVRDAATAFLTPLVGTNTNAGIISFATAMTTHATVPMGPLTSGTFSTYTSEISKYAVSSTNQTTNWDIALRTAQADFVGSAGDRPNVPNLIVFVTDGAPNTYGGTTGSTDTGGTTYKQPDGNDTVLTPAINDANLIKDPGKTHILTVGVGAGLNGATANINALADVSGKDVYNPANVTLPPGFNAGALNMATTDMILAKNYTDLSGALTAAANKLCQGSLTINKLASTPANPGVYAAANGWKFGATPSAASKSYTWQSPTTADHTDTTGSGTNPVGSAQFQWNITDQPTWNASSAVAVAETTQAGFTMDSVVCTKDGATKTPVTVSNLNAAKGTFSVPVGSLDAVQCTVKNTAQKLIDLSLTKTALGTAPWPVDTDQQFRLTLNNAGPSDATGVVVKDTLPAGFTFVSSTPAGATVASGVVTWNVGTLGSGKSTSLDITGHVTQTGQLVNWAQVTAANETDKNSTPNNCSLVNGVLVNAEDDCALATVDVNRQYTLGITKTNTGANSATVGDTVHWDLAVTNNGPSSSAAGATVTDAVPAGLTGVTASGSGWSCSVNANLVSCTYNATLASGVSAPAIHVAGTVSSSLANDPSVKNTACVKRYSEDTAVCADSTIPLTPTSDLGIVKTTTTPVVTTGGAVSFKFVVTNNGPSTQAAGFTVTDPIPAGLGSVSVTPTDGTTTCAVNAGKITCTYGAALANGAHSDVTVTAVATAVPAQGSTATITNTACIVSVPSRNDKNTDNNCSTATVTVNPQVTLVMNKSVSPTSGATVGDQLTYTLSVKNSGPSATSKIHFTDTFDAGLVSLSLGAHANWNCSLVAQALSCDWQGGSVASGSTTSTVTVTAVVGSALADSPSVDNKACTDVDAQDTTNGCTTVTTRLVPKYSLTIHKSQEPGTVAVGGTVTYDLTVTNVGPSKAATGFTVSDQVPGVFTGVSASGTNWDCSVTANLVSCTWTGSALPVGPVDPASIIKVVGTVSPSGANHDPVLNTACVLPATSITTTSALSAVLQTGCDTVTTTFPTGGLTLGKTNTPNASTPLEGFGGTITYVLTATASGNVDQTGVVVSDTVPGYDGSLGSLKTTLVPGSAVCVDGSGSGAAVVPCAGPVVVLNHVISWPLGTIKAGTSKYVTFKVTVDVPAAGDLKDPNALTQVVANVGSATFTTGDKQNNPVISNTVTNDVHVVRIAGEPTETCTEDTPYFSIGGTGFYAGETVKMRVLEKDGTTVYSDNFAQAVADPSGNVQFSNVVWPGYSQDVGTGVKTYPGANLRPIFVQLYGSPNSNTVQVAYPAASGNCDARLSITKSNSPTSSTTITKFGAEITYSMTVSYPASGAYNAEGVVVSDYLPGYGSLTSGTVSYKDGSATCDANIAALGGLSTCTPAYDSAAHRVSWNLGQLRPGDSRTVTFVVTVDLQGLTGVSDVKFNVQNQASATSEFTLDATSNVVVNPVDVPITSGVTVVKSANRGPGFVSEGDFFDSVAGVRGQVTTFRYDVTNTGNTPLTGVVLGDDLNFGPTLGSSLVPSLNSSLLSCYVGTSGSPSTGKGATFTLGSPISGLTIAGGATAHLFCDLLIPTTLADNLLEANRIFDVANVTGSPTGATPVAAKSNQVLVKVFPVKLDAYPLKNIVDTDGSHARAFDNLGIITTPTPKTYRMTIDNVSDKTLNFVLYDYFTNDSIGLTAAQRNAIMDGMRCIDYNNPAAPIFGGVFPNPIVGSALPEIYSTPVDTTFGNTNAGITAGTGAGTFYAKSYNLGPIAPGHGFEIACQTILPVGQYTLTNVFRMVANDAPAQIKQLSVSTGGPHAAAAAVRPLAAAVTGTLDVTAQAGLTAGTPVEAVPVPPIVVSPIPNPSVTKTVDVGNNTAVKNGDVLTYTVKLANSGTGPAVGNVVDTLPAGVDPVGGSFTKDGAAFAPNSITATTITWNGVTVPAGKTVTLTYQVTVLDTATADLVNVVTWLGKSSQTTNPITPGDLPRTGSPFNPITGLVWVGILLALGGLLTVLGRRKGEHEA